MFTWPRFNERSVPLINELYLSGSAFLLTFFRLPNIIKLKDSLFILVCLDLWSNYLYLALVLEDYGVRAMLTKQVDNYPLITQIKIIKRLGKRGSVIKQASARNFRLPLTDFLIRETWLLSKVTCSPTLLLGIKEARYPRMMSPPEH